MNADKHGLLNEEKTNQIIGCARSLLLLWSFSASSPIHPLLTEPRMNSDKHGFLKKRKLIPQFPNPSFSPFFCCRRQGMDLPMVKYSLLMGDPIVSLRPSPFPPPQRK
jgi:hypothetical protein